MPLQIVRQDITKMQVDAIVNTTNEQMVGLSGVDLDVHTSAGPELDKECATLVPLELGKAKITKGYNLDAQYIIHTSGPVWEGGKSNESSILESCYLESLKLAVEYGCESVAFPLISSGTYGYPKEQVLKFAIGVITDFLFEHELMVYLCVFDRKSYEFSRMLFKEISEFIDDKYAENTVKKRSWFRRKPKELVEEKSDYAEFAPSMSMSFDCPTCSAPDKSFDDYMKEMDKSFAYKLFDLIDQRGMTDVECYKKANVDKKTFSKIKCNPNTYRPSKQTAVAFAIALKLNLTETQEFLASAGLTLSRSFIFDKIIMYFLQRENYDIFEINEALFEFDQVLLGC